MLPIVLTVYAKSKDPNKVMKIINSFSETAIGFMSPYPTVIIVIIEKYKAFKYLTSLCAFSKPYSTIQVL